ncbi:MAG: BlaI/MecI/CopY family transcriptional regulator [Planctomycetaceae bacterium]|nr:BlaI/MecI/CopY family transcriptional regulator [Planctomycetaceae bacterium]
MGDDDLPALSEAQMEIMAVVWDRGECTVADVLEAVCRLRSVTRNTIHTMMTRLADKGWLTVRADGSRFVYRAAVDRNVVQQQCVERVVQTVFDGSTEGLVLSLLQNRSLSKAEATRIRRMIREAEDRS